MTKFFTPLREQGPGAQPRPLRVLHLGFEDPRMPGSGGGAVRTREINRRLVAEGLSVTVLTTRYPGCLDGVYDGVCYEHVGIGRGSNRLTRLLGYIAMLPAAVRAHRDAELVVEDFLSPFSSMAVPLWTRRPVIGMVQWLQAREKARQYKLPFHLVERAAVRTHRSLIAVSHGTAERLTDMNPAAAVTVIGNGVDPELLEQPAQLGKDVLFIGRLELWQKGIDLLLNAWAHASKQVDGDLVIAGRGPDEVRVRRLVERLGIAYRVRFAGWVSGAEKARLLAASRLVVVPSRAETFGIVAVEALAAATPVVAFDIPCLREVLPADCARRLPPFDVEALAAALVELYPRTEHLLTLGVEGRAFAAGYDWDVLARRQAAVYRSVVASAASRPAPAAPAHPPAVRTGGPTMNPSLLGLREGRRRAPQVRTVSPAPRDAWTEVLDADPLAVPTQTPAWTDLTCRALGGLDASRLYEYPDGRRLVLPLVAQRRAGLRVTEDSMPYGFGYGGLLVAGGEPTDEDMQMVLADLARRPGVRTGLVPNPLLSDTWSARTPSGAVRVEHLSHVLDLAGGCDAVHARYRRETRRKVRKAETQSLEVRMVCDKSLVDVFAGLNALSVDRWAHRRGQPLWVAHLMERHRDRVGLLRLAAAGEGPECVGWTAHEDGVPVAAYAALFYRRSAFSWLSAMDKELADRTRAGALLQSRAIEHACARGMRWFHLGESEPGSGVTWFKEGFGAAPLRVESLRFERLPLTAIDERLHATVGRLSRLRGGA